MPYQYDSVIADPLFSKKLLESEVTPALEENLTTKIEALYASLEKNTALYYQGSAMGSALEMFAMSEDFSHLITQLEICFEHLLSFCNAQTITISTAEDSQLASELLQEFLDKLKTDFFSDRRALLYGAGKKYIEILSVYINDPNIDLNFRILQIINLLSDEGLTQSCADGCFTRLQYAADNLKNHGSFELPILYKNYLQSLTDEIIHQPLLMGGDKTIIQKIAEWMDYDLVDFEIHIRNFLIKKLKEKFKLNSLEIVTDEYISVIENFFIRKIKKSKLLDIDFQYLIKNFNKKASVTKFVSYLSAKVYESFPMQATYIERIKFLEEKVLPYFGQDTDFTLAEILSEETGFLKNDRCLEITITERLLNTGWLTLNWPEPYVNNHFFQQRNNPWQKNHPFFPPFTNFYKLFYGNLALSWITIEEQREKIVDILQKERGLQDIQSIHSDQVALLNSLVQTPQDLAVFLNHLTPLQHETALTWIKTVNEFISHVLNYYSDKGNASNLLEPLLFFIEQINTKEMRELFLSTFTKKFDIKKLLQVRIQKLHSDVTGNANAICAGLIKKICNLKLIEFSNFIFFRSINFFKDEPYLTAINFSSMQMQTLNFFEDVYRCSFINTQIDNLLFYGKILDTDFSFTQMKNTNFYEKVENCKFNNADIITTKFHEITKSDFSYTNLSQIEFKKKILQCNLSNTKIIDSLFINYISWTNLNKAKIKNVIFRKKINNSHFKFTHFNNVEFYDRMVDNIFTYANLYKVKLFSEIVDTKFNFSTLDKVIFLKTIHQSFFSNSHIKMSVFEKDIFSSIFDYMTGANVSFKKKLTSSHFLNINLMQSNFYEKIEYCDFTKSNLNKINFDGTLAYIKFNEANLNELFFFGNMNSCDFVGSGLYSVSFVNIELNDVNFINSNLIKVSFLESYLIKNYFIESVLIQAKFQNAILTESMFSKANLKGAIFEDTKFETNVDFIEVNLKNAEFINCDLSSASFLGSELQSLKLINSIITPRQLFDIFYAGGVRDFSDSHLSEEDISKSDFLLLYKDKILHEATLSESMFKGLSKLGYRNFSKTDLSKIKLTEFIHFYHNIEYSFNEAKLPQIFLPPIPNTVHVINIEQQSPRLRECLPKAPRNKRNAKQCLINWHDIDPFNKNSADKRNFETIIIDSNIFIDTLFLMDNKKKQAQLIELVDTAFVEGIAAASLAELRAVQKLKQRFYRVGSLFNALSQGIIYENIMMDFLHENYKDVAINIGLLAGSSLSESFTKLLLAHSENLGISGKVFLSKILKLSTPFLRRGLSASYIIYDLSNQASALTKGKKDALINIIGDGFFISFDVVETGIEVLEFSGVSLEIAELITATGEILNPLILMNLQIYSAVKNVEKIKALIPLTPWQTFIEGLDSFLEINPSKNIQALFELNQAYTAYSVNIKNFLEKNPTIKYYVLPNINLVIDKIHRNLCSHILGYFFKCILKVVERIELMRDSIVYLKKEPQAGLLFSELNPLKNAFNVEEIFCNPYKINFNNEALTCDSALIIVNSWANTTQNETLIALHEGYDLAYGFIDSTNTFIVNNGYKIYMGGKHADRFVVKASAIEGQLDGSLGSDLLDLRFYNPENKELTIDLVDEILIQNTTEIIAIRNFERILGRSKQKELLLAAHRTEFLDLQSGSELDFDEIRIAADIRNAHLEIIVRAQTLINNLATSGNFIYSIPHIEKSSTDNANITNLSHLFFTRHTSAANHTFLFDYYLYDVSSIITDAELNKYDLLFNFTFEDNSTFANYNVKLSNFPTQASCFFKDNMQLKLGNKSNLYAFQTSTSAVQDLIKYYALLARRLSITLFFHQPVSNEIIVIGHTKHQVLENDLSASKTHLVANGGGNIYVIKPDIINNTISVPEVIIYQLTKDKMQHILDLRLINRNIENGILDNSLIQVTIKEIGEDLDLSLLQASVPEYTEPLSESLITHIILKEGTKWYPQLMVLFNRTPLQFGEIQPKLWKLVPRPLHFETIYKNIILTKDDIEKDNQIILNRPINEHQWLRDESDLWLTTLFNSAGYRNENYTILFKEFYRYKKMQTLKLSFLDKTLLLSDVANDIANADDLHEKLTALELFAWNEVSKQRATEPKAQCELPPIQARLLADIPSHTSLYSKNIPSSAPSLHHSWLSILKKSIQKTLWQLQTSGQNIITSCWHSAFHRKVGQRILKNSDTTTKLFVPIIDTTINKPKLPSQKNIEAFEQKNTVFQASAVDSYLNLNSGFLQLLDLAIRKYCSRNAIKETTQRIEIDTHKKKIHSHMFFLQERCEIVNDRLQTAIAKYQKIK